MASLPLFPLGTVLVPGAQLPLQIFEPRYLALLRDLLEQQEEHPPVFGVVAIREGFEVGEGSVKALYPVGCAALLTHALVVGEQRFLVISHGTQRFHLEGLAATAGTPYAVAEVSWLGEPEGDPDHVATLVGRVRADLAAYRELTGAEPLEPSAGARELSYALAGLLTLELEDRQLLLASSDTESRLRLGLQLLHREHALAATLRTMPRPPDLPISLN